MIANRIPLIIRRAGPSDAVAIRYLTREVYAKWIPVIGREPMPMQADYDKAVLEHWIDLAEVDGSLIGLIEMIRCRDHMFIENLAVAETMQGKGVATRLLQHAEKLTHQCGLTEVQLATNQAFADNLNFYKKRGYEAYETKAFHLGGIGVRFRKPVS
jgi:N-acetylglutamate synthase-like GNAT family acetyltransferase